MDFTQHLARAILDGGKPAYREFLQRGVPDELIQGTAREAILYIQEHVKTYGALPGLAVIEGKLGIPLPPNLGGDTVKFWVDEIVKNAIGNEVKRSIDSSLELLQNQKILESFEELQEAVARCSLLQVGDGDTRVTQMFEEGTNVWNYYSKVKSGERGILTPWDPINKSTLGFGAQELILFAARSGVGKTWASLMIAEHAWTGYQLEIRPIQPDGTWGPGEMVTKKHKVLYVTTEMSKLLIALRFFALQLRIPFGRLRSGHLTIYEEEKLKKATIERLKETGLGIVGGNFDFRADTLAAAVDENEPDIVIIDGIYLIKVPGKDRIEQAANAFTEVKRLATAKKIPVVVTSQFNREVKKNQAGTAQAESVALTDAAVWHATNIFGLVQTEDMQKDKRLLMKQLKTRDGTGKDFEMIWDLDNMEFKEVPTGAGAGATGVLPDGGGSGPVSTGGLPGEVAAPSDNIPF